MKITEVVKHVKRDKLPRDPEWLRNRIFHLISSLWFHYRQLEELVPDAQDFSENAPPGPVALAISMKQLNFNAALDDMHVNPVFKPPLYGMLKSLEGAMFATLKYPRPRLFRNVAVTKGFPKIERLTYHLRAYEHVQEDLERTVRSAARLMKS